MGKGIRSGQIGCRLVAVTCHYDVTEWLAPDWVIDMATGSFTRRRLRRPPIELEIFRCRRSAWRLFARHHYLSGVLSPYARCFLALWQGEPVAFCATVALIGHKRRWRISRIVTLPDYQGIGIGMAVAEAVAELHVQEGNRVNVTASHPVADRPLPPLAAVEGGRRQEDRLARIAEVHRQLSRLARPGRRVVRVCRRRLMNQRGRRVLDDVKQRRASGHPQRRMQPEHGRQVRRLLAADDPPRGRPRSEVRQEAPPGEGQRRTGAGQEHPQGGEQGAILAGGGLGARTRCFPKNTPAAAPT